MGGQTAALVGGGAFLFGMLLRGNSQRNQMRNEMKSANSLIQH